MLIIFISGFQELCMPFLMMKVCYFVVKMHLISRNFLLFEVKGSMVFVMKIEIFKRTFFVESNLLKQPKTFSIILSSFMNAHCHQDFLFEFYDAFSLSIFYPKQIYYNKLLRFFSCLQCFL